MPLEEDKPLSFWEMEARCLENSWHFGKDENQDAAFEERHSQAAVIRQALLEQARELCKEKGYATDTPQSWEVFEKASYIGSELTWPSYSMNNRPSSKAGSETIKEQSRKLFRLTSSVPPDNLVHEAKNGKSLNIDKDAFEEAVGLYLNSELRASKVDRLVLMTLIDVEITHYLREIFETNPLVPVSQVDTYRRIGTPILTWFTLRLRRALYAALFATASIALLAFLSPSDLAIGIWISGILALLWFVDAMLGLFALPSAVSSYRLNRERFERLYSKIPDTMLGLYYERWTDGPISIPRMRHRIEEAAEIGVVWPSAIWPLLDDLETREIKLL